MNFLNHFDQAFCINLDKRVDRWEETQHELKKIGIEAERVSAIDGSLEPINPNLSPGFVGCNKSHLKVLNLAKDRGYKSILFLEDDVEFSNDFHKIFDEIEKQIPDYDMLYFSPNPVITEKKKDMIPKMEKISDNVLRITGMVSAHCIIIKDTVIDKLIKMVESYEDYSSDIAYAIFQEECRAYCITPSLAWQRESFSDICNENVYYDFLKNTNVDHIIFRDQNE